MRLRRYGRIAVELSALISGRSSRGQGVIVDISLTGCRAQSDLEVKKDDSVGLLIDVPGYERPIYVTQAAIKWANDQEFGMEFVAMELSDRQRLQEVVKNHPGNK